MDREKVIKKLAVRIQSDSEEWDTIELPIEEAKEILTLLKEQEAIPADTKVIGTSHGDMEVYCCRDCRTILDPAFHYCPNCGKAVTWE